MASKVSKFRLGSPKTLRRKTDRDLRIPWWRLKANNWCTSNGYDQKYRKELRAQVYALEAEIAISTAEQLERFANMCCEWFERRQVVSL